MTKIKILYAEDDETLAFLTKDNLEQNNYEVFHCSDGYSCLRAFKEQSFDLCILDIMLPKLDGFELTAEIRKINPDIPLFFLSAKVLKEDRIKGLRLGADDYLVKPFSIEELLLKIDIFLRRPKKANSAAQQTYELPGFVFNTEEQVLYRGKLKTNLTQREAQLLRFFLENRNRVVKREEILKCLWGDDDYFMGRSLDVFISRLRKILSSEPAIQIENIHGVGFKFLVSDGNRQ